MKLLQMFELLVFYGETFGESGTLAFCLKRKNLHIVS